MIWGRDSHFFFTFFILGCKFVTEFMPGIIFSLVLSDKAEHAEMLFRFTSLNILYSILWCFRLFFLKHIISQLTDSKLKWKQVTDSCLYFNRIYFTALKRNGYDDKISHSLPWSICCSSFSNKPFITSGSTVNLRFGLVIQWYKK